MIKQTTLRDTIVIIYSPTFYHITTGHSLKGTVMVLTNGP